MRSMKEGTTAVALVITLSMLVGGPGLERIDADGASGAFGEAVFIGEQRIDRLRARVEAEREPTWSAWRRVKREADQLLDHTPNVPEQWYVPPYYEDARGHREAKATLERDANATYTLALVYRITRENRYAEAAVRLINAWSELDDLRRADDSTLSFSYHFPAMLFGADLLRGYDGWSAADRQRFATFVRNRAIGMNTMDRANNWGNWGLVLVLASAAYLEDQALFDEGVERWKHFIEHQIADDGHLPHEVTRNNGIGERGIWYSHFTLMPQAIAAEIAHANGVDLYDYESPSGRTLRAAFHRIAPWARDPDTFPYFQPEDEDQQQLGTEYVSYFELLNPRWPQSDAEAMLEQKRPLTARHSAPHLTFTHGRSLSEN